ncbi:TPA: hypothetical protein DCX15_03135 [bacterium]|nr:hypothetical protein [bacterium]
MRHKPLIVDLSDIKSLSLGASLEIDVQGTPQELGLETEGVEFISPLRVQVNLLNERDVIDAKGKITTEIRLECNRCLNEFSRPFERGFHLEYHRGSPKVYEGEWELKSTDLEKIYYQGDAIDLRDGIRDEIFLGIPMKPLCQDTCLGLCPLCGQDLNKERCNCRRKDTE